MTKESEIFEKQISRILELLESSGAEVTWNDHIADPDNAEQHRQIDISIKREGKLTLVECRHHHACQDVKWIEELIGRRISLGADSVVAVSSSGFTRGAVHKAARFGVILRDVQELADAEIRSWGRTVALTVYFYQYLDLKLLLFFDMDSISRLDEEKLKAELKFYPGNQSLFNAAAEQIDRLKLVVKDNRGNTAKFRIRLQLEDFRLCGEPVVEVEFSGRAKIVAREVNYLAVLAYGAPTHMPAERDVVVEKYCLGESSITHSAECVSVLLDLSTMEIPPLCQFRYVELRGARSMNMEIFRLFGIERLATAAGQMEVSIIARETHSATVQQKL